MVRGTELCGAAFWQKNLLYGRPTAHRGRQRQQQATVGLVRFHAVSSRFQAGFKSVSSRFQAGFEPVSSRFRFRFQSSSRFRGSAPPPALYVRSGTAAPAQRGKHGTQQRGRHGTQSSLRTAVIGRHATQPKGGRQEGFMGFRRGRGGRHRVRVRVGVRVRVRVRVRMG